jgi:hypothetical protein
LAREVEIMKFGGLIEKKVENRTIERGCGARGRYCEVHFLFTDLFPLNTGNTGTNENPRTRSCFISGRQGYLFLYIPLLDNIIIIIPDNLYYMKF